ncbi:hypothetical protein [Paenibacillus tengchongensis]|uniref:hypothetical protein n=1 Tax=Paenibacillus tengchongensis TaxID=2608684 RepID=UPI00124EEB57|nr:hypothetical protein [Paenibacillus tengchongensis]
MMKNRSFLFGLGAGLIIGALLLQLMIAGGAAPMTKEQLVREAAKLNLVVEDPATPGPSPSPGADEGNQPEQEGKEGDQAEASAAPASPVSEPSAPEKAASASPPAEPSAPAVSPSRQPVSTAAAASAPASPSTPEPAAAAVNVRIPTGATLSETADLLASAGVITDKAAFLDAALARKINRIIQYGSYSFTRGESNDSIIDKLITVRK